MLWFQVGAIDLNRPGTKLRSRGAGGSGEPPLPTLDIINLVIGRRAINFDRVLSCVGAIKGS